MRAVASMLLVVALGCAKMQDLGSDRPSLEGDDAGGLQADTLPLAEPDAQPDPIERAWDPCPMQEPDDRAPCKLHVAWCSYRRDPALGLAAKCSCGVDGFWSCLLVRDDDRRNDVPVAAMAVTNAACVEGAPCDEGVRCTVASQRACHCTSAGRLVCARPPK